MARKNLTGNIVMAAVVCAGIYAWMNRDTLLALAPGGGENAGFAESACLDAAKARFGMNDVRIYRVKKTNNGYVVSGSISSGKIICLTNPSGGVEDVMLEER